MRGEEAGLRVRKVIREKERGGRTWEIHVGKVRQREGDSENHSNLLDALPG